LKSNQIKKNSAIFTGSRKNIKQTDKVFQEQVNTDLATRIREHDVATKSGVKEHHVSRSGGAEFRRHKIYVMCCRLLRPCRLT
jgi:hypothetical protein